MSINEVFIKQVIRQSLEYYDKASKYDKNNEVEGALINYLLSLDNLNSFKQYINTFKHNKIDEITNTIIQNIEGNFISIDKLLENRDLFPKEVKDIVDTIILLFRNNNLDKEYSQDEFKKALRILIGQIQTETIEKTLGKYALFKRYNDPKLDTVMKKIMIRVVILQDQLKQIKLNYLTMDKRKNKNKEGKNKEDCDIEPLDLRSNNMLFEDIIGQNEAKEQLINGILNPILYPKRFPFMSKGILFWGPPGTGKTMIAKALVNELEKRSNEESQNIKILFYGPTGAELKGKYVGETEKNITKYFKCASQQATDCEMESICGSILNQVNNDPTSKIKKTRVLSVLFIDEIDAIAGSRADDSSGLMTNSVNTLLQMMDGVASFDNVIVVGATNYPWKLDSAVNRRFDTKVLLSVPETIEEISDMIKLEIVLFIKKSLKIKSLSNKVEDFIDDIQKQDTEKKAKFKNDGVLCNDNKICLPAAQSRKIGLSINEQFNIYRNAFFPGFSEKNIRSIADMYRKKSFTQGDLSNIMKWIYKKMGDIALNKSYSELKVANIQKENLKNYNLYPHNYISYKNYKGEKYGDESDTSFWNYDTAGTYTPKIVNTFDSANKARKIY